MAHLLGGGGGLRSRFRLLLAIEGSLDAINDARRQYSGPLHDGLVRDADSVSCRSYCAAQKFYGVSFKHAELNHG